MKNQIFANDLWPGPYARYNLDNFKAMFPPEHDHGVLTEAEEEGLNWIVPESAEDMEEMAQMLREMGIG